MGKYMVIRYLDPSGNPRLVVAHECDAIVVLKVYGMRLLESPPLVMTHLPPPRMNITPGFIYIYIYGYWSKFPIIRGPIFGFPL